MVSGADRIESEVVSTGRALAVYGALVPWFENNKRDLNFRKTSDAYVVMVSEFMLQQTTVATVEAYFARFMKRFPTIKALALAPEEDVLGMWAGLGYYRRARQLHAAARAIVAEHNGTVPRCSRVLEALPGIGRYTAGAIASTAYDEPAPILEANTVRVFARLTGSEGMVGDGAFMKRLWKIAQVFARVAPSPGRFNVAAMELGSLVCRPKPLCEQCPVSEFCVAYKRGVQEKIPTVRPRRESVDIAMIGLALRNIKGEWLVRQIPDGEWHAGLWEFPTVRVGNDENQTVRAEEAARELTGLLVDDIELLMNLRYQVTHHRVKLAVFRGKVADKLDQKGERLLHFLSLEKISSLPLGSAQKKLLKVLEETDYQGTC